MKKTTTLGSLLLVIVMLITLCKPPVQEKSEKIEVTAKCDSVLVLYKEARAAFQDYKFKEAQKFMDLSLEKDSGFFMANYIKAMNNLKDSAKFAEFAGRAVANDTELSDGEKLLKNSLEQLLADRKADVTTNGKQLIALYPTDVMAYYIHNSYLNIIGDTLGVIENLKSALDTVQDKSSVYNNLGYLYMMVGELDSAAAALDTYIELNPDHPNPYDSKGDYFMKIEDYKSAYESYLKATEIDSTWTLSGKKAEKAKMMIDSLSIE